MGDKYIEIDLSIIQMTDDAVFVNDGDIEEWIPWSQIQDANLFTRDMIGTAQTFEVKEWILIEKEFI